MSAPMQFNFNFALKGCEVVSYEIKNGEVSLQLLHPENGLMGPVKLPKSLSSLICSIVAGETKASSRRVEGLEFAMLEQKRKNLGPLTSGETAPIVTHMHSNTPWPSERVKVDWDRVRDLFTARPSVIAARLGVSIDAVCAAKKKRMSQNNQTG